MECKHCGNQISEELAICEFCGASVSEQLKEMNEEQKAAEPEAVPEEKEAAQEEVKPESIQYKPEQPQAASAKVKKDRENPLTGMIGALIGAAIGAGVIILLGKLGLVASVSGFILAVCTLKGYEILGRRIGKVGIVFCLILIAVTPYVADRLEWAIAIKNAYSDMGVSLVDAFRVVPDFIKEGAISVADYAKGLALIYLFAGIGAFSTLRSLFTGR